MTQFWAEITDEDIVAAAEAMHDHEYFSKFGEQPESYQERLKDLARAALESFASLPRPQSPIPGLKSPKP